MQSLGCSGLDVTPVIKLNEIKRASWLLWPSSAVLPSSEECEVLIKPLEVSSCAGAGSYWGVDEFVP